MRVTLAQRLWAWILPKVNTFIDLGTQAFDFKVNSKSRYYFAGISLDWNIFSGNKNTFKIRQAQEDTKILQSQANNIEQQLKLQLTTSINAYQSASKQYEAAQYQVTTAQKYLLDMQKIYKEGQAIFIELLDAQNQLINAQLQSNVQLFDMWIKASDIERANANFNLK